VKNVFLLGIAMIAAGCAVAPDRGSGPYTSAKGEITIDLHAESYSFSPAHLAVPAGKEVVLRVRNEASLIPHSFVLENEGSVIVLRQPLAKAGETIIRIPPLPAGPYVFYCDESFLGMSHRKKGMEGKLEAKPAD
jgi:plastocyanin